MEVNPQLYYNGAKVCSEVARSIHSALKKNETELRTCGKAAGSDSTGKEWASSYNARITEFYSLVYDSLIPALENYASLLDQGGYNWELANYNARHDKNGQQAPAKPGMRQNSNLKPGLISIIDGPGNGLKDGVIGLVNSIGIPVPDGDTDQLEKVANSWRSLATEQADGLRAPIGNLAKQFGVANSPDAPDIVDELFDIQSVIDDVIEMFTELAGMVQDQKNDTDHLRKELLVTALEAVAIEVGTKAILTFASSFVTFGLAAVVGSAAIAASVAKWGPRIAKIIEDWNDVKKARQAAKAKKDLPSASKKTDDIKNKKTQSADDSSQPSKPATPGFPPDDAKGKVPQEWGEGKSNKKKVGQRWEDPNNQGNGVRIDQGNPNHPWSSQQQDHVIVRVNGKVIGRDGKPIEGAIDDNFENAHIPLSEWKNWKSWDHP